MRILGIDPGMKGGYAWLPSQDWSQAEAVSFHDVAWEDVVKHLPEWLCQGSTTVLFEKVGAMPGQGVVSTGKFMKDYGILIGIIMAYQQIYSVRYDFVSPYKWQRKMLALETIGDTKERSRQTAMRLFPHLDFHRKSIDHGKSDALLIALWGQQHGGFGE